MTTRVRRRPMRIIIVATLLGALLGVGLLSIPSYTPSAAGQEEPIDRVALVRRWFEVRDRGDVDAALAMMTDAAVFVGGGLECTAQVPCAGIEPIRKQFELQRDTHETHVLLSVAAEGSAVTGRFEARNDRLRARGFERIVRAFIIQMPRDKISVFVSLLDLTDPPSARNTGQDPSPPNPAPADPGPLAPQ